MQDTRQYKRIQENTRLCKKQKENNTRQYKITQDNTRQENAKKTQDNTRQYKKIIT